MFPEERRTIIAKLLREQGRVQVTRLAERMGVAEETIRRDLRWLEEQGLAVRTHGGALLRALPAASLEERAGVSPDAKRIIGTAAAQLVEDGESVLIDSGSTALEVARAISRRVQSASAVTAALADVHVVTNSLAVATEMARVAGIVVNVLGGSLQPAEMCLVGPETVAALARYRPDRAFVACAGLDLERGLAVSNTFEAEVKRAMLQAAAVRVVVADASKLGRRAMVSVCGLEMVDCVVTDSQADSSLVAALEERGVSVVLAR